MISNPKHGWCDFELGDFKGYPSYLTEVPIGLLDCFINYYKNGSSSSWFDEEGTEFTLVINPYSIYIIEEKEVTTLRDYSEFNVDDLVKELITDINRDMDEWKYWSPCIETKEKASEYEEELLSRIKELEKHIIK